MNAKTLSKRTNRPINYFIIVTLLSTLIVIGLEWQSYDRFQTQQQDLASRIGSGVASHIVSALAIRAHQIELFAEDHTDMIAELAEDPDNDELREQLHSRTKRAFPGFFAMTIADSHGEPLLDDFEGDIGEICLHEIKTFVNSGVQRPLVHPNYNAYHIDQMAFTPKGHLFFASFYIGFLQQVLAQAQPPGQQFFLIKRGNNPLIEMSSDGSRETLSRENRLSEKELTRVLYRKPIDGTQWELVVLQDYEFLTQKRQVIIVRMALLVSLLLIIGGVLYRTALREQISSETAMTVTEKARKQAENEDKFKSLFLSVMNHELRTPLNALQGFVDILSSTPLDQQQQKHIANARKALRNVVHIIESVFDASLLQTRQLTLESLSFSLYELLNDTTLTYQKSAESKGLEFNFVNRLSKSHCVQGSPTRINQVVSNILDNAIKFTSEGSIGVIAEREGELFRLIVSDTGIGISESDRTYIFESFSQADDGLQRSQSGMGLGATIAKRLVEMMNGSIQFESESGQGTRFTIEIPLAEVRCPNNLWSEPPDKEKESIVSIDFDLKGDAKSAEYTVPYPMLCVERLSAGFDESMIHQADLEELLDWSKGAGLKQLAENLEHAIEEFDFKKAKQVLNTMTELAKESL